MLVSYKADYEKIAMGFLSYEQDLKDLQNLKTELKLYTTDENHALYLYREETDNNFCGVVGLERGTDYVLVRHLSLAPDRRDDATVWALLNELDCRLGGRKMLGSPETTPLLLRWQKQKKEHAADGLNACPE